MDEYDGVIMTSSIPQALDGRLCLASTAVQGADAISPCSLPYQDRQNFCASYGMAREGLGRHHTCGLAEAEDRDSRSKGNQQNPGPSRNLCQYLHNIRNLLGSKLMTVQLSAWMTGSLTRAVTTRQQHLIPG